MNPVSHLHTHLDRLACAVRLAIVRAHGVEAGRGCRISAGVEVAPTFTRARRGRVSLGADCTLERGVLLHPHGGHIQVARDVFFGPYAVVYGQGGVEIGPECLIAMHCRILSSTHTIDPAEVAIRTRPDILRPTRLERDVWLGAGVTVLGGVTIGEGCVVGAGAVVTRDLPPFSIAVGAPARVVGRRPGSPSAP